MPDESKELIDADPPYLVVSGPAMRRLLLFSKRVLELAPFGLPEDVATLHGPDAAHALQDALEGLRSAVAAVA
jgi:hypothetical protein